MAIELLDPKKQWAKIKAGFQGSQFYKSLGGKNSLRFVDGINSTVKEAQQRPSPFSGKTFSQRSK